MSPFYDINTKLRYIKCCLLLFTFLFVLTGVALIIIGTTMNVIYSEYAYFLKIEYFQPATCLVNIGFVIFAIATVGLFGTCKENPYVIGAFGALLGAVCLVQLGIGFVCFSVRGDLIQNLRGVMNETIWAYRNDVNVANRMDRVQENLYCCGMDGPHDWAEVYERLEIPRSCCTENEEGRICAYVHSTGCYSVLSSIVTDSSGIFITSACVLSLIQLTGMIFAVYMAKCIKHQVNSRRQRKLLLTEQLLFTDVDATKCVSELS